jgi:hypothetical protein
LSAEPSTEFGSAPFGRPEQLRRGVADRRRDDALFPGDEVARCVEARADTRCRNGTIEIVLYVFLARPDQFDRRARGLRERDRLHDEVGRELASEAAAQRTSDGR